MSPRAARPALAHARRRRRAAPDKRERDVEPREEREPEEGEAEATAAGGPPRGTEGDPTVVRRAAATRDAEKEHDPMIAIERRVAAK